MIPREIIEQLIKSLNEDFIIIFTRPTITIGLIDIYKTHEWIDDCTIKLTSSNEDGTERIIVINLTRCDMIEFYQKSSKQVQQAKVMTEGALGLVDNTKSDFGGYG